MEASSARRSSVPRERITNSAKKIFHPDRPTPPSAGNWAKILKDPKFATRLKGRSNKNLSDKWRALTSKTGKTPTKAKSPVKTPAKKVPTQKQEEITTDGGNKKGKLKRPRGDAVPRKDAGFQEENATPATNQESQNTHQRSDKRPRTDSKVGEEEEEESYEAAMKQISSISGEQRAKLPADMKKKLKDAETTQAKGKKGDLINQLKKCCQDVDKITVFLKLGEKRKKAIAAVRLFERNLKDRKVGKGILNELRTDANADLADVQKEYEVEHPKMTRAFKSLPDKTMLNQKKGTMNNLIKAINDLPISHTYKQAADYLERHRLVDAGKWHFVKHLKKSEDHAPAKGYGSWFDFWAKVTGKDPEKCTPIRCAAEGCDETMIVTKKKGDEQFKAVDFMGCHVLIARGRKDLNNWTYEEKVAIVPACRSHNTDKLESRLIEKDAEAAVIPPLFGDIPRFKPDALIQERRRSELKKAKTHWKTLAIIACEKEKGADGKFSRSYKLTLRGEDIAKDGPYTWNTEMSDEVERDAEISDEVKRNADKIFGDFMLKVNDNDFLYKYLAPMLHTSIFDEGPREVRRDIILTGKCEVGHEWHALKPWKRDSPGGPRLPPG